MEICNVWQHSDSVFVSLNSLSPDRFDSPVEMNPRGRDAGLQAFVFLKYESPEVQ
jgi:hypothetical protein